jgi:hypothetical protein
MKKRVCFTLVDGSELSAAFVLAWPWSNRPEDLSVDLARAISQRAGGLPVVLMVAGPDGLRHTFGCDEHIAIAASLDPDQIRWHVLDIDEDDLLLTAV